jgi:Domain of Unknown Function (DUF1521)
MGTSLQANYALQGNFSFYASVNGRQSSTAGSFGANRCGSNQALSQFTASFEAAVRAMFSGMSSQQASHCRCSPPSIEDSCHPAGSLTKDDKGVITTPGGYKIEATGATEWTITGKDGKSTKVWGDPHVAESDGGKWDFKKDSTFVLDDGTKINVKTKDAGNGTTITSGLDITNGRDRVQVTDIDKGKGKVGEITNDGLQANYAQNDQIVMGEHVADWGKDGKVIVGSDKNGEELKLGDALKTKVGALAPNGNTGVVGPQQAQNPLEALIAALNRILNPNVAQPAAPAPAAAPGAVAGPGAAAPGALGGPLANAPVANAPEAFGPQAQQQPLNSTQDSLRQGVQLMQAMFQLIAQIMQMLQQVNRPISA